MGRLSGVKFFQQELDYLKLHFQEYAGESPLRASTLSTYLLLHFICDEFGRIREDEFVLKHFAEKFKLPHHSTHRGYHHLFELGLIQINVLNGKSYITITKYADNNMPGEDGTMNYFIIPHHFLQSGVINDFIRSRDVGGIIELLQILNSLSRETTRNGKKGITLKVTTVLKRAGKTTRNITDWLNRLVLLVNHKEDEKTIHRYMKDKLFTFSLVKECYIDTEYDEQKSRMRAALRKELQSMLSSLPIPYTGGDSRDAFRALQQDCLDLFYPITSVGNGIRELRHLMQETVEKARYILQHREGEKIGNFGGFFRAIIRTILDSQYGELHTDYKVELKKNCILTKTPLPAFLNADQTLA